MDNGTLLVASATRSTNMTPKLWQRLKPLFHAALERAGEDRATFINEACGEDAELKQHLVQLIKAAEEESVTVAGPMGRSVPSQQARFSKGEVLLGRFRILRQIGRGGMGEVYEAEDLQLGRVALKTIRDGIASSSGAFDRFRQEVQLARRVSGSKVCRIHELYLLPASGQNAATAFLTMEYLDGITLSERLKKEGPLPLKDALRVAVDVCEGLGLVHDQGVIHRDLKSANIMLCGEGNSLRAVLMDFGLAHDFGSDHSSPEGATDAPRNGATVSGAIVGTPAYMAPEQFEGTPVSPATDIYALGIVLYELVTALHPYAAPTPVAAAIRRAQHPAPPSSLIRSIPHKWDRIIQRCLQYEPANRFQSAAEVSAALRTGPANLSNLRQDRPWIFRFACAALIALIAWGIFTWWRTQQYYHPSPEAFAQYTNGLSLIRQGNYAEATRVLQEALDQDEHFIMAHARLAEAWQNLDFQGNAQHDLLLALPGRSRLPELDRMYLDAIAATVTGDSSGALERYKRILVSLPPSNKSSGYVDLGMAYERVGDIARALDSYSRAAVEDTNNPAAFMHTGILQSRLHHVREGDKAFDRAQAIFKGQVDSYGRQGNPEGLAEVDYERGYAMNDRGDSKGAEVLLERALDEAEKIPSVQLQIRALTQLTSAEYNSYQDAQVVEHAERAIRLARDNQLQSWAANGLVRLATEQMIQGHLKQSEQTLDEAMQILRQSPQPRVLALANSTLANVMDQEDRPDKVAELAQAALDFYKKNGFSEGATAAGQLLVRAKTNEGQYKEALESANEFLAIARQTGAPVVTTQAEEALGAIYLQMERYPDALTHFQNARHLAPTDSLRAYQVLGCAETLWRLGRYSESQTMPQLASGSTALLASVGESRAESLISQQKFGPALALARKVIAENTDMPQNRKLDLEQDEAVVEAHLGMKKQALTDLSAYGVGEAPADNPIDAAHHKLAAAEIYLWVGMNKGAYDSGQAAKEIFASNRQLDSQLRSTYLAAAAAKSLNDDENYRLLSKEISDICQELEQEWGQDFFHDYISRPDLRALIQRAAKRAN